jgi:hypothetical protein
LDDPRRSVVREETVASEQVVVEQRACLTDSVKELAGRTVTAMLRVSKLLQD